MAAIPPDGEGLFVAAAAGDVRQLNQLLAAGADVNRLDAQGRSCLRIACEKGHGACALFLLPKLSAERLREEADKCLLESSWQGLTETVRQLLARGANANAKLPNGRPVLHRACDAGHLDVVRVLVDAGAELNSVAHEWTPLAEACFPGKEHIAFYLLDKGADPMAAGGSALIEACCRGCPSIMQRVLQMLPAVATKSFERGLSLLHCAAIGGSLDIANMLLAQGADVNARQDSGETPLMILARGYIYDPDVSRRRTMLAMLDAGVRVDDACYDRGHTALRYALTREDPRLNYGPPGRKNGAVDLLLERGASVNTKDNRGITPLHSVCIMGSVSRAIQLLKHGAFVSAEDNDGFTPLALACAGYTDVPGNGFYGMTSGHVETIRALIARGADFGASFPGGNLVDDGRDMEVRRLALEACACRALLQAYAPRNQPLVAPRAARWLARRLDAGVPGVSTVVRSDLPEEGAARSAVRELKLEPLRDDAWERRKHVVVCRALTKARWKAMMDQADAGSASVAAACSGAGRDGSAAKVPRLLP